MKVFLSIKTPYKSLVPRHISDLPISAKDLDLLDPLDFCFLDPDRRGFMNFGSAKICRATDPDPRGKISTKNCQKELYSQNPNLNF